MNKKVATKNASDVDKVEEAKKELENERRKELNDIRAVLAHAPGRRLLWRLMEKCKTFGSIWESNAKIHYNAGQQDLGHFIMSEIGAADPNILFKMMKENMDEEETTN